MSARQRGARDAGLFVPLPTGVRDFELLDLVVEDPGRQAKQTSGVFLHPIAHREGLEKQPLFHVFPLDARRQGSQCGFRGNWLRLEGEAEIFRGNDIGLGHQNRPFHRVFQLSDVPGPTVALEELHRRWVDFTDLLVERSRVLVKEVLGQKLDVPIPLPQRGNLDGHNVQPVVQVLTEAPFRNLLLEVLVCGRDDPNVDLDRPVAPKRSNSCSCSTRRSFACVERVTSEISSRNTEPPLPCSKRPMRSFSAPVKAPRS